MSRGVCKDTERRIKKSTRSVVIDYAKIVGAKVRIKSTTMQNGWDIEKPSEVYTVSEVGFRVTIDGKCHTILAIKELGNRTFALKDIEFVELNTGNE